MESTRGQDAVTYTAMAAGLLCVGLFLFTIDMRTVSAPAEHIFIAEVVTALLAVLAVVTGAHALALRVIAARGGGGR